VGNYDKIPGETLVQEEAMLTKSLFETPLSIQGLWLIKDIRFYSKRKRLDIYVDF
jgi:hypothetical protein